VLVGIFFMETTELIALLKIEFESSKNTFYAKQMEDYMKNHFRFFGIRAPERKQIQKPILDEIHRSYCPADRLKLISALWEMDEREYQLAAMDLLNKFKTADFVASDIDRLEYLIITKSWWDSVDTIASNALGVYFKYFPEQQKITINKWSNSGNIWLMRSCLIFQLKYKKGVDFELLTNLIRKFQSNNEFFIQKAIGWSLRQYSKYDPQAVRDFMAENKLSGLAKREASKYLG
jgi:3-methyladenine DNA glycosylase AlkD